MEMENAVGRQIPIAVVARHDVERVLSQTSRELNLVLICLVVGKMSDLTDQV